MTAREKPLARYAEKRAFERTPEPRAGQARARIGPLGFVVQLHRARREHYDFRLEVDGVLKSWAVPNGLPLGPGERRLAVQTEDHPLDYANFEGTIPRGEYGAGAVIVWDCGAYSPLELGAAGLADRDAAGAHVRAGLDSGSLKFRLRGTKLKGAYALVRTKDCWLVVRHADQGMLTLPDAARSALTGRTLAEVGPASTDRALPFPTGTPESLPRTLAPMLAATAEAPVTRPGWHYEPKLDGWRVLASVGGGEARLRSRNGEELAARFPGVVAGLVAQEADLLLDGELVALDPAGRPSFALLQSLALGRGGTPVDAGAPVVLVAFDLLHFAGLNLRRQPWRVRRRALEQVLLPHAHVQTTLVGDDAERMYHAALATGHEGIVAKRIDSHYAAGQRSDAWQKVKPTPTADYAIGGYTRTPRGIGALLLGEWRGEELCYVGSVGTGLGRAGADLQSRLDALRAREAPFARPPHLRRAVVWVRPELTAEVSARARTRSGRLREPVFQRLRTDLPARAHRTPAVSLRTPASPGEDVLAQLDRAGEAAILAVGEHRLPVTNLDREYWPAGDRSAAVTKRDLLRHLARLAPLMLPHLEHRPVTAIRLPTGLGGERFFQKHFTERVPEFVATVRVWSEHRGDSGEYVLCNDLPTLLWLAQNGALEFHVWHSRAWPSPDAAGAGEDYGSSAAALESSLLNRPDFLVFDLDPYLYSGREAPGDEPEFHARGFAATKRVAFALRDVLLAMGFTPYVKLSGKTGLHVFVAIERTLTFDVARALVGEVGRHLLSLYPKEVTMEWSIAKRTGKVFFDHNMNVRGKTLPAAYSPRAVPGAPLSWPLTWDALEHAMPRDFRIGTVADAVARGDAWATILTDKQNVERTLGLGGHA